MGKKLNLDKEHLLEINGNGLELRLTLDHDNGIMIEFASEDGGRQIGVKPHPDHATALSIYFKDQIPSSPFRLIKK